MSERVGVEIEFLDIKMQHASDILAAQLNARAQHVSEHEHLFETSAGDYRLEVDFELLKKLGRKDAQQNEPSAWRDLALTGLGLAAQIATPLELVTPPLERSSLPDLDALLNALAEAGAKGTGESIAYAFGVHFNPETDLDHRVIVQHLQAFLCMHDWLSERDATDLTRKLTAFALPFSTDYECLVLDADYKPDQEQLIDDYLEHNPTRNRALDMLPLFAHLDAPRVEAVVEDKRVKARPTYHYRLPNSRVGEPDWSILSPWEDWLKVESVARDTQVLGDLCAARLDFHNTSLIKRSQSAWIDQCHEIVSAL